MINIIVKLQFEAIHRWPECNLPEVEYLKYPHRHIFYITCKKKVEHTERQIEIISLKRKILEYLKSNSWDTASCELIASNLFNKFRLSYCSVLEDNENGAEVC